MVRSTARTLPREITLWNGFYVVATTNRARRILRMVAERYRTARSSPFEIAVTKSSRRSRQVAGGCVFPHSGAACHMSLVTCHSHEDVAAPFPIPAPLASVEINIFAKHVRFRRQIARLAGGDLYEKEQLQITKRITRGPSPLCRHRRRRRTNFFDLGRRY